MHVRVLKFRANLAFITAVRQFVDLIYGARVVTIYTQLGAQSDDQVASQLRLVERTA